MPASPDLFPETKLRRVISASRRTDMVATHPDGLVDLLKDKAPPSETHTVMLWTKDPTHILSHASLFSRLKCYDQCYLHLTITGLGGTLLEPRVPKPDIILQQLDDLITFLGTPDRLNIRFDPIVHFRLKDGNSICNLDYFAELAPILEQHYIKTVTTSWVYIYGKVAKRLAVFDITTYDFDVAKESEWLHKTAKKHKLVLHGCCVPGWPRSQCINGALLNELHPRGYKASTARAAGQRPLCGCTRSIDIGWYTACVHGCLYCYGHPQIYNTAQI